MNKKVIMIGCALAALAVWSISSAFLSGPGRDVNVIEVTRGPLQVWTAYEGTIQSRTVRGISSQLGGSVTVVELIPEGTRVAKGDPLARLDTSSYERELVRVQRSLSLAQAEYDSLTKARIPLERSEMEIRLLQARSDLQDGEDALTDLRELVREGLIPEQDAVQQEKKNAFLRTTYENIEQQLNLTRDFLHPAAIDRANAELVSAKREWEMAQQQLDQSVIAAPSDGIVVYQPLPISSEFRTVRVGDSIFRNQVFITIPDMSNLIVQVDVPEYELTLAQEGRPVTVSPVAYPGIKLSGVIESVGSMAQSRPDRPGRQKYFQVIIRLLETRPELRSGMSARVQVLSYDEADTVLIPRTAVTWENNEPYCTIVRGSRLDKERLVLGVAGTRDYAVREGLEPGQRVVVP